MKWTLLFVLTASLASAEPSLLSPEMDTLRQAGFTSLFNMDYETALIHFREMTELEPRHPGGYIYVANTVWLHHLATLRRLQTGIYNRNNSFFRAKKEDTTNPQVDREFHAALDKGILLAEARVQANKNDLASLYYLGVAKNILAGYQATVKRSFFSALKNGRKGVDMHRTILKKDPSFVDAKLSVGMYNYIAGSLPLAAKIFAFFGGVHGSKKEGVKMLEAVSKDGKYAKDEATVLLVMLYNREKRVEDCLKVLTYLTEHFPGNSLFRLEKASLLGQLKRYQESAEVFEALLQDRVAYNYMPDFIHYQYASMLSDAQQWEKAVEQYECAATTPKAPLAMVTDAHLQAGKCLDAIGQREQAIQKYRVVLQRPDVFESQKQAKKYLKKPFKPA